LPEGEGRWGTPGSRVRIAGDATLARDLERLFSRLDPDWEAQLSDRFGDVLGHQIAAGARGAAGQLRETLATLEDMTAEFFQRPGSPLARTPEISTFGQSVDTLRDATERLEARLRLVRERRAAASRAEDEAS
jgi:ubiquinone biosynthesis accessory factor UbiJ